MKKVLALILALMMALSLVACGGTPSSDDGDDKDGETITDPTKIPDEMTSEDGKYQVAFITDVGDLKDQSFNEGTYDGVKLYAANNGKSYKYYRPGGGNEATDDDRIEAMKLACDNGAEVVVAAGFLQENALVAAAQAYPDVNFVFIDGYPVYKEKDAEGKGIGDPLPNVAGVAFQEEQAGYLAGYAAVKDGYTKLGYTGGGGGTNPACNRYGYGFLQGAEAAAAEMGVKVEMNYSFLYGGSFSASNELQTMATGWYQNGTEVIFCAGGSMFASVTAAAAAEDAKVIGVDVDQSYQSATVVTSALKGLADATSWAIGQHYDGTFDKIGGVSTSLGAKDNAVGLPTATWSLEGWSVEEYEAMFAKMVSGEIKVDAGGDLAPAAPESTANVTVNVIA